MNHFFMRSIQKIIKQREEQPPEQVTLAHLGPEVEGERVNKCNRSYKMFKPFFFFSSLAA